MSARFIVDSKKRSHYLLHQERSQSCGPACVAMAEGLNKVMCMINPEARARQLSQNYPSAFDEVNGTVASNLAFVLIAEGVPTYASTNVTQASIFDYCKYYVGERTPIIAHIAWAGGGGHFTLLRQIDPDGLMIFLDPWYDVIEIPRQSLPNYNVPGGSGNLSGWLTITHR